VRGGRGSSEKRRRGKGKGKGKGREEEEEEEEENRQKVGTIILDYRQGIVKARARRETEEATGPVPSPKSTVGCLLVDQVSGWVYGGCGCVWMWV